MIITSILFIVVVPILLVLKKTQVLTEKQFSLALILNLFCFGITIIVLSFTKTKTDISWLVIGVTTLLSGGLCIYVHIRTIK